MTAANSTPLSDGASAVLLASEEWAKERGLPVLAYFTEAQTAAVDHVHKREGLLMAPAYAMPRDARPRRADPAGLRLLRDPRGLRRAGALHAGGLGGPGLLHGAARPRQAARRDRPRQAQRQRRLARRRPPVRRDRRADRRRPRQAAARRRQRPRRDQHLRRRRPGRRRDPRERLEAANERPLLAARQRAGRLGTSPSSSACRSRSSLERHRPGAPGRRRARCSPAPPPAAASSKPLARPASTRSRPNAAGAEGTARRSSSTPPASPTRPSWSSCSASSTPPCGRLQRCGRVVVLGTPPAEPAPPAPPPRSGRWRASPARSARRSAARRRPCSSSTSRRAPRTSSTRPCASCSRPARPTSPARWCRIGTGVAATPEIDWERPLDGQGGAGHRRLARDRRGDRRRPWPATAPRSSGSTCRRWPTTCARSPARLGGEAIALDITAADAPERIAEQLRRRRRRRRPQRRRHPRPHDREDAGGPLERADGDQPLQRGADQRRAARRASCCDANGRIVCVSSMAGSPATPARPTTRPRRPA